ncbi:MAG: linear amide C-N hydrolase [bacterium]|nr:linear amide C-N hydrolase [bacterium]
MNQKKQVTVKTTLQSKHMRNIKISNILFRITLTALLVLVVATGVDLLGCTSFLLKNGQDLFFVHSLNQGNVKSVPGMVFINSRGQWKNGYDWPNLVNPKKETLPNMVWKSKFGSVTFNPFGKDLPDGGMNEAGLYIWEKNFDAGYPNNKNKPKLFQCLWMQYVLDNFSSVDEVIKNAHQMSIDGWGWHYFVADKTGKTAIIDFLDGKVTIYSGSEMPVPLACNSHYSEAMQWLKLHKGFGGDLPIKQIHEELPRFVYGAKLLKDFNGKDPVNYSFHVLDEMSVNVRWSIVFDYKRMRVYFKTNLNQNIRYFDFTTADFNRKDGPLMLDIETPEPKNIRSKFAPFSRELHVKCLTGFFGFCFSEPAYMQHLFTRQGIDMEGVDIKQFVQIVTKRLESPKDHQVTKLQGQWTGKLTFPATKDGKREYTISLDLNGAEKKIAGTYTIETKEAAKPLPMTNIDFKGEILTFSVMNPETGNLVKYQLHRTAGELKGYASYWYHSTQPSVSLTKK